MVTLLDANVLIALAASEHEHHRAASDWLAAGAKFATTPITQGALVRFLIRAGVVAPLAAEVLSSIIDRPQHEFWPDDLPYDANVIGHVVGHGQVTDAYLMALARHRGGRIASFDKGLASVAPQLVELLAT